MTSTESTKKRRLEDTRRGIERFKYVEKMAETHWVNVLYSLPDTDHDQDVSVKKSTTTAQPLSMYPRQLKQLEIKTARPIGKIRVADEKEEIEQNLKPGPANNMKDTKHYGNTNHMTKSKLTLLPLHQKPYYEREPTIRQYIAGYTVPPPIKKPLPRNIESTRRYSNTSHNFQSNNGKIEIIKVPIPRSLPPIDIDHPLEGQNRLKAGQCSLAHDHFQPDQSQERIIMGAKYPLGDRYLIKQVNACTCTTKTESTMLEQPEQSPVSTINKATWESKLSKGGTYFLMQCLEDILVPKITDVDIDSIMGTSVLECSIHEDVNFDDIRSYFSDHLVDIPQKRRHLIKKDKDICEPKRRVNVIAKCIAWLNAWF